MTDERTILALVAGVMTLVLVGGGFVRRGVARGEALRLGAIWLAIIAGATLLVTIAGRWIG